MGSHSLCTISWHLCLKLQYRNDWLFYHSTLWSTERSPRYRTLFPYKPDPKLTFLRHTQRSRIQNLGLFWGPQKQERKNDQNYIIFWEKNKLRRNFIWVKLMKFLLFKEVLKNLFFVFVFLHSPIKNGNIMLILSKF